MDRLNSLGYAAFPEGGDPTIRDRSLADPKDRITGLRVNLRRAVGKPAWAIADSTVKLTEALRQILIQSPTTICWD